MLKAGNLVDNGKPAESDTQQTGCSWVWLTPRGSERLTNVEGTCEALCRPSCRLQHRCLGVGLPSGATHGEPFPSPPQHNPAIHHSPCSLNFGQPTEACHCWSGPEVSLRSSHVNVRGTRLDRGSCSLVGGWANPLDGSMS